MLLRPAADIFGLSTLRGVSSTDLKHLYHELAGKYHPDKGGTAEEFIRLREAYTALKDAVRRGVRLEDRSETPPPADDAEPKPRAKSEATPNFDELWARYTRLQADYQELYRMHVKWDEAFNIQIKIINQTVNRINEYTKYYEHNYTSAERILNQQLRDLEEHYRRKWWEQLVPVPKLTEAQYVTRHNHLIEQYNAQIRTLNKRYNEQITGAYQQAFETFVELIKDL